MPLAYAYPKAYQVHNCFEVGFDAGPKRRLCRCSMFRAEDIKAAIRDGQATEVSPGLFAWLPKKQSTDTHTLNDKVIEAAFVYENEHALALVEATGEHDREFLRSLIVEVPEEEFEGR